MTKHIKKGIFLVFICVMIVIGSYTYGLRSEAENKTPTIETLQEILIYIDYYYVEARDRTELIEAAITALIDFLDKEELDKEELEEEKELKEKSSYLTSAEFKEFKLAFAENFGQIEEPNIIDLQEIIIWLAAYLDEEDETIFINEAIKGIIQALDSYSAYLSPEEYEDFQTEFEGKFGGIGIIITMIEEQLTIVSPITGTPGERIGLQSMDKIIKIDGISTENMSQSRAVELMRGEPGTRVVLTIAREEQQEKERELDNEEKDIEEVEKKEEKAEVEILELEIIRDIIEVPYVEGEMINEKIGYIAIAHFVNDVGNKVAKEIEQLKAEGAEGIILELRNNPGGLLPEAIKVVSNFIPTDKEVVSVKQRITNETIIYHTEQNIDNTDLPLVVLINKGSASGSEIVAGVIQDYNRGVLVGTKTFGKGVVQTAIPLRDKSSLVITTTKYYIPSGRSIHEDGVEPDILIEFDPDYEGENDNQLDKAIEVLKEKIMNKVNR